MAGIFGKIEGGGGTHLLEPVEQTEDEIDEGFLGMAETDGEGGRNLEGALPERAAEIEALVERHAAEES